VRRFERGNLVVDLGGAEAILPVREQVQRESYRAGDRIVAFVVDIDKAARGPQIILSRTHKGLLEKLFEMEVPEIYEKIDIVPYDPDPARFVCNAIAPAEVARVIIDAGSHTMELIVPDEKLSLAIGKKGQNVRLASQLTGWRIDIHSESKVREMEARARQSLAAIKSGGDGGGLASATVEALFQAGWRSAAEVASGKPDELASVTGVGGAAGAQALIVAAGNAAEAERARVAEEAARAKEAAAAAAAALPEKEAEADSPEARQG